MQAGRSGTLVQLYCASPLAAERLEQLPDGGIRYRLKTPCRNGASHTRDTTKENHFVFFSRLEVADEVADVTKGLGSSGKSLVSKTTCGLRKVPLSGAVVAPN